jgi:sugar phosphate isomerase/epimerase
MIDTRLTLNRRQFALGTLAAAAAASMPSVLRAASSPAPQHKFCAFTKYLQSLSDEELAAGIAAAGFDGVEVPVRKKDTNITPENCADTLPKLKEALTKHGLEITIVTTDLLHPDEPHAEAMLRAAKSLGVERYRLGFYRYDLDHPILPQLAELQPVFRDIAAMNRDIGISGLFQNHSGATMVGATVWDLDRLIENIPPEQIGCVFDIRHAAVEAGEAWPVYFDLMKPHITAASFKDFRWNGRKSEHVPFGQGLVDPKFIQMLEASGFSGPISVHVEYLPKGDAKENLAAITRDFATLRQLLKS